MKHLGSMKVHPNGKKVLERRLIQLGENRERTPFVDLDWYELGDVREAIEKKKAKTFKTCNIKAAQEQLREHNITFYSQYMDPPEVVKALNIHVSKKRQGKNSQEMAGIIKIINAPNALRLLLPQDTEIECEADMYLHITRIFEEMTGIQMPYYAESGGVLYTRLIKALLAPQKTEACHRNSATPPGRAAI